MFDWRSLLLASLAVIVVTGAREEPADPAATNFLELAPAPAPAGVVGRAYGWEDADWELPEKVYSLYKAVKYLAYEDRATHEELRHLEAALKSENATLTTAVKAENATLNTIVKEIGALKVSAPAYNRALAVNSSALGPAADLCQHVQNSTGSGTGPPGPPGTAGTPGTPGEVHL